MPSTLSGDKKLYGVKMQYEPHLIPEGYAAEAINMRFNKGVPETRLGPTLLPWMNKLMDGQLQPWGKVYGVGTYRDPSTRREYTLIAADGLIYFTAPGNAPKALPLPGADAVTTPCRFVQCFNVVLCLRGPDMPVLKMDNIFDGFTSITQTDSGDGTLTIPNSSIGLNASNRLFLVDDDSVLASDLGDFTRYTGYNELRINEGSEDALNTIGLFGSSTIIALKELSIYRVDNVYGDLAAMSLSRVTQRYGCIASKSAVDMGSDFIWLSHEGIASLTLTNQNEVQSAQGALTGRWPMFSDDIRPLIDRINWQYASNAVFAFNQGKLYCAVPLDDAERLGPERVLGGKFSAAGTVTAAVQAGATYRWQPGTHDTSLTNGSDTVSNGGDFKAQTSSVTIHGTPFASIIVPGSLKQLYKGINNAILVYDTLSGERSFTGAGGAWAGYDESNEITVRDFFQATYLGQRRLFLVDADGWVKLYEEDYTDALAAPYCDVEVSSPPAVGDTMRINSGTLITASASGLNSPTTWGCPSNEVAARINLVRDNNNQGGYYVGAIAPWTAPDTINTLLLNDQGGLLGLRFISTNGVLPRVDVTGSWATLTPHTVAPIQCSLLTRGYDQPSGNREKFRYLLLDVQTWNPSYGLSLLSDGVNKLAAITRLGQTTFTKDRTRYTRPFDRPRFDASNSDGLFLDPDREDYSIIPDGASFAILPPEAGLADEDGNLILDEDGNVLQEGGAVPAAAPTPPGVTLGDEDLATVTDEDQNQLQPDA